MKLSILFCFLISSVLFSQTKIEGNVYDFNKEPLSGTSVYIDGTTIGTTTNELGYFSLEIPLSSNSVLIVRNIGFKTHFIELQKISSSLHIFLDEDVKELKEVVVEKTYFSRDQMLKLFKEQFLGTNAAGKSCVIENEDDLYFDYDRKKMTINVYSDQPLIINNKYLGYKIEFQLVDFQCKFIKFGMKSEYVNQILYAGNSLFVESNSSNKILKRRQKSFEGSTLHFFRNFITNTWDKSNFVLFNGSFQTEPKKHFKLEKLANEMYRVEVFSNSPIQLKNKFLAQFNMLYANKSQSKVIFHVNEFFVDAFGVHSDYDKIIFSGEISNKRVGDLLPSNYMK